MKPFEDDPSFYDDDEISCMPLQGDIVGIDRYSSLPPKYTRKHWVIAEISDTVALLSTPDDRYCIIADPYFIYKNEITAYVKPKILLIHTGPGEEYEVSGYLMRKEKIQITAIQYGWGRISESEAWIPMKEIRRARK